MLTTCYNCSRNYMQCTILATAWAVIDQVLRYGKYNARKGHTNSLLVLRNVEKL